MNTRVLSDERIPIRKHKLLNQHEIKIKHNAATLSSLYNVSKISYLKGFKQILDKSELKIYE